MSQGINSLLIFFKFNKGFFVSGLARFSIFVLSRLQFICGDEEVKLKLAALPLVIYDGVPTVGLKSN